MKPNTTESYDIDILQIAKLLLKRAWLIFLCGLIVAAMGFSGAKFLVTPQYSSSVKLYVNNRSTSAIAAGLSSSDLSVAQSLVNTYIVILRTRDTLDKVLEKADITNISYKDFDKMITADSVNSTEVFSVTVTCDNPQTAAALAKAVGEVLPKQIADIVVGTSVKLVDGAIVSKTPVSPNVLVWVAVGFIIGALVCCAAIVLKDMTDDIIHSEDYLLQAFDLPVLAVIPNLSAESRAAYMSRYAKNSDEDGKAGE